MRTIGDDGRTLRVQTIPPRERLSGASVSMVIILLGCLCRAVTVPFVPTGPMMASRAGGNATLLPDGTVLIAGGANRNGQLKSAEIYSPASGAWTAAGAMGTARVVHTATLLPDGRVLAAGGYSFGVILAGAEIYTPSSGAWTVTGTMGTARRDHSATLLLSGKVLVTGGSSAAGTLSSAEIYDPASGVWTAAAQMGTARKVHRATRLPDGRVLVTGGNNGSVNLSGAELYDPSSGAWTATAAMGSARVDHTQTALQSGNVLVTGGVGGSGYLSSAEIYSPSSGAWTATGAMGGPRRFHAAALLPDGRVLVSGGFSGSAHVSSAEVFAPASGTWTATGPMGTEKRNHDITVLPGGKALVSGGYNLTDTWLSSAELYGCAVSLDPDGGAAGSGMRTYYSGADTYGPLPVPLRTGYLFGGWWSGASGAGALISSATLLTSGSDHTLTAAWSANTYTVTFDPQGGTVSPTSKTVTFDAAYGALPVPATPVLGRVDRTFGGWFTGCDGTGVRITEASAVAVAADHSLFAKWQVDPYISDPLGDGPVTTAGAYQGYFYNEMAFGQTNHPAIRGTFALELIQTNGLITATARLQRGKIAFRARAWTAQDEKGTRLAAMTSETGESLTLLVRQNRLWGTLSGGALGNEAFSLDGARDRFARGGRHRASLRYADTNALDVLETCRGYYTASLPLYDGEPTGEAQAVPKGSGYLTLTVGHGGSVKIAGELADGTGFSQHAKLILFDGCGPDACVPLFAPLYAREGWIGGLLWLVHSGRDALATDRDLGWFVRWEKPAARRDGATALLDVVGGRYGANPSLEPHYLFSAEMNDVPYQHAGGAVDLQADALPDQISVTSDGPDLIMEPGSRPSHANGLYDYSARNSAMATLHFNPGTGIFKGRFNLYYDAVLHDHPRHFTVGVPYGGVLTPVRAEPFLDQPAGQGFDLVPDGSDLPLHSVKRSYRVELDGAP